MPSTRTAPKVDIISIGTLSRNRLWSETEQLRTAHATTSLIRTGKHHILIDPGLPAPALQARLFERTGLTPNKITAVFLTNFRPAHRQGLSLFPHATTYLHDIEQQAAAEFLDRMLEEAPQEDLDRQVFVDELKLLNSFKNPDDKLDGSAGNVDLFPLFGYTPGTCGLLVSSPTSTTLIAGDAVPTQDHFLAGQVLPDTWDIKMAHESLAEAYEIADLIVPGHDNIFINPRSQGM
jgi:glyoxylase-like metal-dependent hydrolase (beta-lactamase superfamily II)